CPRPAGLRAIRRARLWDSRSRPYAMRRPSRGPDPDASGAGGKDLASAWGAVWGVVGRGRMDDMTRWSIPANAFSILALRLRISSSSASFVGSFGALATADTSAQATDS